MKVDRNEMVGGVMEPHETHRDGDVDYHAGLHIGGIPLRLEIAARLLVPIYADMSAAKGAMFTAAKTALADADALIAAHNATCGEVSDG